MGHHLLVFGKTLALALRYYGEVSEWFKELVLKTSDPERDRGFESHPLRQDCSKWRSTQEAEEDGLLNR